MKLMNNKKETVEVVFSIHVTFWFIGANTNNFVLIKKLSSFNEPSGLFRFIPISVSEPMWIIASQSKKRFVSRLMINGQKSILLYPINSETSILMNPNQSETNFSIRSRIDPNRISNENQFESFRLRIHSDWFLTVFLQTRYKTFFGLVRNDSHWLEYRYRNEFQSDTFARDFSMEKAEEIVTST